MNESILKTTYWPYDGETFNYESMGDLFDDYDGLTPGSIIYYGYKTDDPLPNWMNSDKLIEILECEAFEEFGEIAEGFPIVTQQARKEFDTFIAKWLKKHVKTTFYHIEGIKEYTVTEEDLIDYWGEDTMKTILDIRQQHQEMQEQKEA
jgi:hypothetical protein